jgi:hypothetical protein
MEAFLGEALAAIRTENGYRTNVLTVEFTDGPPRDLNRSECPAILISTGDVAADRETFGGAMGNSFFRLWSWELTLVPGDSATPRRLGYELAADIEKCLLSHREGSDAGQRLPMDISIDRVDPYRLERTENRISQFRMLITVKYQITLADL